MKPACCLFLCLLLVPFAAESAVTINEVAWMGDSTSVNHEWIELYNDGGAVSVEGWILSDGENLTIELTGTIADNSFAVLERTSDDSAPGNAFLIYTGALKNTGATLQLLRDDGGLEDQVSGGEDWQNIGGDNTTKETAQYTAAGWVTAPATPGASNKSGSTEPATVVNKNESTNSSVKMRKTNGGTSEPLTLPGDVLRLDIDAPEQVFVNQPVAFEVSPSGVGPTIKNSLDYQWNFGDINTSAQQNPTHVFAYPGTYMVSVQATFATQDTVSTHEITVLPVTVSLTTNSAGDIQINNDSPYDIDISGYRLRGHEVIELPPYTWLLSRQTITVPHSAVQASPNTLVALYDSQGHMVTSQLPVSLQTTLASAEHSETNRPVIASSPRRIQSQADTSTFKFVSEVQAAETVADESELDELSGENVTLPVPIPGEGQNWPVIALVVLLSFGCVVVLMQPLLKRDSLDIHESE